MERRRFIRAGALSGLSIAATALPGNGAAASEASSGGGAAGFTYMEAGIAELQAQMASGRLSSRSLVKAYLKRMDAIDADGPMLRSVIERNPEALEIAAVLDAERKSGKLRGPLHGIPILVKDNIDTGDRMMTTAGSLAMEGNVAQRDAFVVSRLREAGAVIIGKTNLSEWANFRSTKSNSGWSSRGGQTRNPYVLSRTPSGSSSGSAVAVSANLCVVAVGTETDGSVIAPSSACGIVGVKPTVGLVSRSGIIPISRTQDTAGPMARTVRDAAVLLSAMAGMDPADAATAAGVGKASADYTAFLDAHALKGRRIGVERRFLSGNFFVVGLFERAVADLKRLGAEVVEVDLLQAIAPNGARESIVLQYEFKDGLNRYLSGAKGKVRSLEELINFNRAHGAEVMPWFRQETLENSQKRGALDNSEYTEAVRLTTGAGKVIDDLMQSKRLDAIVGTSIGIPGFTDHLNGDYGSGFYFCQPAAIAGYPNVTVPMGFAQDLPVGLSFMGAAWQEGALLGFAYAYEQATMHRRTPAFRLI